MYYEDASYYEEADDISETPTDAPDFPDLPSFAELLESSAPSSDLPKCMFVHGVGESGFSAPTSTFEDYWGNVHTGMSQCSSVSFVHYEAVALPWDSSEVLNYVCDFLNDGDTVITNKLIFSHSMGGNVVGYALKNGFCTMDSSSKWYAANPPQTGSFVANQVVELCNDDDSSDVLQDAEKQVLANMQVCGSDGTPNAAYISLKTTYPSYEGLLAYTYATASGVLCGNSQTGLGGTMYFAGFPLIDALLNFEGVSDGVVDVDSCGYGTMQDRFDSHYTSPFYIASINHIDGSCRDGEPWQSLDQNEDRNPCQWYWHQS